MGFDRKDKRVEKKSQGSVECKEKASQLYHIKKGTVGGKEKRFPGRKEKTKWECSALKNQT